MTIETFPAGKLIFSEGDFGDRAYRILQGSVEISIQDEGGKLVLSTLGVGEIFGEMAMVESRSRSATARVLEQTEVEVLAQEDFQRVFSRGNGQLLPYLTTIFDRLRMTNDRLLVALDRLNELEPSGIRQHQESYGSLQSSGAVNIRPDSSEMKQQTALQEQVAKSFPFQFGRRWELAGTEAVIRNQLLIADRAPYRVSRKHCVLGQSLSDFYIEDRTSKLGTIVNGIRIGGQSCETRVKLTSGVNTLILGGLDSQVRFVLTVGPQSA
jgi:CRP-like cAMP-binding protein